MTIAVHTYFDAIDLSARDLGSLSQEEDMVCPAGAGGPLAAEWRARRAAGRVNRSTP